MSWMKGVRVRLRGWLFRSRVERELEEELRWHLEMETEKHVREGMSPTDARRRALVAFGGVERFRDAHRDVRGMRGVERLWYDTRYAMRALARSRSFTVAAAVTLALGIGANATAFGMLNALLYRAPAGVGEPEGLHRVRVMVNSVDVSGAPRLQPMRVSYPDYADLRDRASGFQELSAYWRRTVILGHGPEAEEVPTLAVSPDYFETLRIRPALGRFWTEGEDDEASGVVVLAHGFWEQRFAGSSEVIGRTIELSGLPMTVIGVAPPHFRGVDLDAVDLWIPLGLETRLDGPDALQARNTIWLWMVGRPAPGLSPAAAAERATEVVGSLVREYPDSYMAAFREPGVDVAPISDPFGAYGRARPIPLWLLGVTGVVLLIACANVSALLLARGAGRRRELAVRSALGASRARLVQLLLIESLLLAAAGGLLGLVLAAASVRFLDLLDLPPLDPFVDFPLLLFAFSAALVTSLVMGFLPALRASRRDIEREIKDGAPRAAFERSRTRAVLTVGQIALSVVLLVNAGLFVQSLKNVSRVDPGLEPERTAAVALRFPRGTPQERLWEAKTAAVDAVRALPGVSSAALTTAVPYGTGTGINTLSRESLGLPGDTPVQAVSLDIEEGYFTAVGQPIISGRGFDGSDRADGAPVVVVSSAFAELLGGPLDALGRCVPSRGDCAQIVGVVADSRFFDPSDEPMPVLYRSIHQMPLAITGSRTQLLVRAEELSSDLAAAIRREISAVAPDAQFVDVESMASLLRPRLQSWRVASFVFTIAGGMAFVLAAVGLYGVIAYLVASRTHEVGVRLALGARPLRILRSVLGEGVVVALAGAGVGAVLSLVVTPLLAERMYGVEPSDPVTLGAILLLVIAMALAATLSSALRAMRVDPVVALRSE
jgi:predicted permease